MKKDLLRIESDGRLLKAFSLIHSNLDAGDACVYGTVNEHQIGDLKRKKRNKSI